MAQTYLTTYQSFKIPSLSMLNRYSSKPIINPSHKSCIDTIESILYHCSKAAFKEMTKK